MIAFISGKITDKQEGRVVVAVGGFGMEVFVTPQTAHGLRSGQEATLYTYLRVWDTGMELYGFVSARERAFFELLIGVNGVGPRVALNIMAVGPIDAVAASIREGDERLVSQAQKVGKKLAGKVILELKDKVGEYSLTSAESYEQSQSVIEALVALGYSRSQAREAVSLVGEGRQDAPVADQVKAALQILAK